ncbi:hypothetical protein [Ancylomarina longa]|uniref:Uncharacterized protein n=1 Tax=Ancylomarina longa TaxID=2487017 RepID=A0A434AZL5_9BACT|nr:hypothetical protein [Ancylomarina longa]RUT80069.1 hypothetical protein DLK05_01550 [Ancylomarina longa]
MKYPMIVVLLVLMLSTNISFSQCRNFAKEECKPKLEEYIHDGNYNGVVLNVGEQVELHKAFFSGQKYRMVVCPEEQLPPVHFKVMNDDLVVLFDNKDEGYIGQYDFEIPKSTTLIISMEFVQTGEDMDRSVSGCVALLFGMKL